MPSWQAGQSSNRIANFDQGEYLIMVRRQTPDNFLLNLIIVAESHIGMGSFFSINPEYAEVCGR
jgi:hypothetical protein